ncbi:dihydroflavonol-4-reductase [Rhizobium sp. BK226]|uniref:SDR family oxidoreductase n=1 Tax=unclassified Rhizobium TaxID=2613769 RepID=UPI00160A8F2A|nr:MULTISPECIES: aldehyde reductase [unclassified Rhizobium]MBB4117650.1 dihydroflavonol-4-reductase [Rhizobium sp. BK226]MBB4213251.1 dihydroflavonol-4-reductase [Rhizobium sp. BK212]
MTGELVLVTGGTGFIAQYCMLSLLNNGYRVRTTIRSPQRQAEVREHLRSGGVDAGERLSFVFTDLNADHGWPEAVAGCAYVIHGASPTPSGDQTREEDWIKPAVNGNLRVLRASRDAGVRRVVLTSAFGAIGVGHKPGYRRPFDETDWSDLNGNVAPYQKSKTLAERAAWDFVAREGNGLELAAVNPVAVYGPVLGADYSHSIRLIANMMSGQPGCLNVNSCCVDVRDVADLHLRAMTNPAAKGERFLATVGESMWMIEVAELLRRRLGKAAAKVSTQVLTDDQVRTAGETNEQLKGIVPLLGYNMNSTGKKAEHLLGWAPRSREEAIVSCAESLIRLGLLRD